MIPTLAVFLVAQRQLVKGIAMSGSKVNAPAHAHLARVV